MPVRRDVVLFQNNSEQLALAVTQEEGGAPQDITGKTLHLLIKPTQNTADSDPSVVVLSSGGVSPVITITNAPAGLAVAAIPAADLASAGLDWWRLDVVEDSKTSMYGSFTIQPV